MIEDLQSIYSKIHERYDLINHVLTMGFDVRWRKSAVVAAAEAGGTRWIDLCCGTGEMAILLKALAPAGGTVLAADLSKPMLSCAVRKRDAAGIGFVQSAVEALPFPDESFDIATVSFAARNLNLGREPLVRSFREIKRVLREGGRFINLETSRPENRIVRWLFHSYVRFFVKPVGMAISGSATGYGFLSNSILHFYSMREMSDILREAGFIEISSQPLIRGIAAIHTAVR